MKCKHFFCFAILTLITCTIDTSMFKTHEINMDKPTSKSIVKAICFGYCHIEERRSVVYI